MHHTKFIKRIAVMLLSMILVLGSSLTAFSATIAQSDPKTTGIQLVGNSLVIQENHHNFYIWGKSVMLQCPGVTDVIPNNNTKLIDVQFGRNLYKGIEEILIVKTQGKDDKIRLEEGSMIVTGVTTPEQVLKLKDALKATPTNLVELKYALIGADVTLGATKNYIVEKDSVKNESGAKVDPKSIEGTAELISTQTVTQAVTQTPTESKPEEKKGEPGSSLSPPRHLCNHVFDFEGRPYVKCLSCGDPSPFSIGCTHVWNTEGKCTRCNRYCVHVFPEGEVGAPCKICGYQSTMSPCQHEFDVDGNHYVVCTKCGAPNPSCGGCNHNWDSNTGICTKCSGDCLHQFPQGMPGAACTVCGFNGSIPPAPTCQTNHALYCPDWVCPECYQPGTGVHEYEMGSCLFCNGPCPDCETFCPGCTCVCGADGTGEHSYAPDDDETHTCDYCEDCTLHSYDSNGYCAICMRTCSHGGADSGTCFFCHKVLSACSVDHSQHCAGWICNQCEQAGTKEHAWYNGVCGECRTSCSHPNCNYVNDAKHKCTVCGMEVAHDYEDGYCSICSHNCQHSGESAGETCRYCEMTVTTPTPCQINHSTICSATTCVCGAQGTGGHTYIDVDANDFHRCSGCGHNASHEYEQGVCSVCVHTCTHSGHSAGETCRFCYIDIPCPIDHSSELSCLGGSDTYHECPVCRNAFPHVWDWNGHCYICDHNCCHPSWTDARCDNCDMLCDECHGEGTDVGCDKCGKESPI